jgi:hypothetical protein
MLFRARICKRLPSPGIDSEESIQSAYVAWQAGTTNRVVVPVRQAENRFLGSLKGLQIRAQAQFHKHRKGVRGGIEYDVPPYEKNPRKI